MSLHLEKIKVNYRPILQYVTMYSEHFELHLEYDHNATILFTNYHADIQTDVFRNILRFYAPQLVPAGTAEARISYGDSVRLSVRHKPVPNQAQVR